MNPPSMDEVEAAIRKADRAIRDLESMLADSVAYAIQLGLKVARAAGTVVLEVGADMLREAATGALLDADHAGQEFLDRLDKRRAK